jgi:hypothetical protein
MHYWRRDYNRDNPWLKVGSPKKRRIDRTLLLLLLFVITFMHGIYNYVPETNHVSRVHSVTAIL